LKPAPPVRKLSPSMIKIYGTPPPVSLAHKRFRVCLCHLLVLLYGLCTSSPHTHTHTHTHTCTHGHIHALAPRAGGHSYTD
jgi:ABC-type nickel/cobalt efflux system permease component RcnA